MADKRQIPLVYWVMLVIALLCVSAVWVSAHPSDRELASRKLARAEKAKKEAINNQLAYHDAVQKHLYYVQDKRTGLCFAVWGGIRVLEEISPGFPADNSALTEVPCTREVMVLINGPHP